jgi:capsular polysaccharide biosynthesis protein
VTAIDAVRALRERWWILVAAAVLAAAAAYAYVKLPWVEPRWRSSVLIQATGRLDYGNFLALEKELRPLAEQVRQLGIMRDVDRNLHTDLSPSRILDHTRAEPVQDSGQIRLDVEDSDKGRAEQLSLEIADVYTRQHNAAEQGKLREERVILSTLDRGNEATLIWPQTRILVPAAGLLGLLVAGLVVLGAVYLDDSIRSAADVRQYLDLPLLGIVPRYRLAPGGSSVLAAKPEPEVTNPVAPPTTAASAKSGAGRMTERE